MRRNVVTHWPRADAERLKIASEMVASGHGEDFLPNMRLSAATFLDFAQTPNDIWDFFGIETAEPVIMRVRSLWLARYGAKDVGTVADLEHLRTYIEWHPNGTARVDRVIIENADHSYDGQEAQIAQILANWMSRLPAVKEGLVANTPLCIFVSFRKYDATQKKSHPKGNRCDHKAEGREFED